MYRCRAWENSCLTFCDTTTGFLPKDICGRMTCRNSIVMMCYYLELGSVSEWMKICFNLSEAHDPDRVVTYHLYVILRGNHWWHVTVLDEIELPLIWSYIIHVNSIESDPHQSQCSSEDLQLYGWPKNNYYLLCLEVDLGWHRWKSQDVYLPCCIPTNTCSG